MLLDISHSENKQRINVESGLVRGEMKDEGGLQEKLQQLDGGKQCISQCVEIAAAGVRPQHPGRLHG